MPLLLPTAPGRREVGKATSSTRLPTNLRAEFPEKKRGPQNLAYMRAFAAACSDEQILQQAVAQLP
jgi:hypothetical protein